MNTRIHIISAILSCRSKDWFRSGFFFLPSCFATRPGPEIVTFDWEV